MATEFPEKYTDPLYASLDARTEEKLGLPVGLLSSIRVNGERSNHTQTNEHGTFSVYQFVPQTKAAILKKYGLDISLSPENASEGAGLLLKENIDRNKGDVAAGVGEYVGGLDRANWGPVSRSYINRVMAGQQRHKTDALGSGFAAFMAQNPAVPSGRSAAVSSTPVKPEVQGASPSADPLVAGFGEFMAQRPSPSASPATPEPGVMAQAADVLTGGLRRTPTTDALPDWAGMPELNSLSLASAKTGLGTMLSNPAETAQIIKANFPNAQVRQDEKGNFLIRSGADNHEYAIKPGFQVSDIPRALGALAAFTPAGRATSLVGGGLAAGGTQALIEASQSGAGGEFNPGEIATASAFGGLAPVLMRAGGAAVNAVRGALSRVRGVPSPAAAAREGAAAVDSASVAAPAVEVPSAVQAPMAAPAEVAGRAGPVGQGPVLPSMAPVSGAVKGVASREAQAAGDISHIWRNADTDIPVKFVRVEQQPGPDGRMYARVSVSGKESFVPADELVAAGKGNPVTKPTAMTEAASDARAPTPEPLPAVEPPAVVAQEPRMPTQSVDELAGTARTAALGGFGSKKATRTLAAEVAPDPETVAAAKRLGVLEHLQPDHYTTNQAYRQLAQLVKSQTGSSAAVAQREGLLKLAETADGLVTKMGGSSDLSTLSADAAQRMQAANVGLKARARELYAQVDQSIGLSSEAPAPNVVQLIKENARKLGGEENLPAVERDLLKRLSPKDDGTQPTYALLDKLRKDIGEARRGKQNAFGNSNTAELTQLENALRADQAAIAQGAGVGELWETAQATARAYKGIQEDLKAIYGKELDKSMAPLLTGAVNNLGKGNTAQFIKLLKATPEGMRKEVTASGLASFFQKTTRGGEMDFAGYSRWYDGLQRNKQAYAALMSNLPPEAVKQLADLARVAKGVAMSKGEFIATGKALNHQALETAEGMMAGIYDEIKRRGINGAVAEVVGTAAGAPGLATFLQSAVRPGKPSVMKAADELLTSPEFVALVNAAGTKTEAAAARRFGKTAAFSRYVAELGRPREMSNRERWVLGALHGKNNARD